ncbi:MAG: NYN domain-containing protein [Propionibacteriaceae bacterium]|nr:NYN domain-containing protein [Propionibacteriaceae bacterium]
MTRVVAYVDGFNLYFGLKAKGWKKHYWLDLNGLATSLLKPGQTLAGVHYFTSRIRANGRNVADMQRQSDYLDALATLPSLTIHYGHYLQKSRHCHSCGAQWMDYEEKMTDVNIAMQLLADAFDDHFDTALVISADSDLTTPVRQVRARFPAKRVIVAQPPGRNSVQLAGTATAAFTISETKVRQSQLPAAVATASGYVIHRPAHWR